jgi:hypothetical protein
VRPLNPQTLQCDVEPSAEEDAPSAAHPPARPAVTFAGALPPPVTGMTAMTEVIVDALRRRGTVQCFNWSRGKPLKGWRWKVARTYGAVKTLLGLIAGGPVRGGSLYYPVSSGIGLYNDLVIAALARTLGYRLILHHHAYSYIDHHDWRAALLVRLANIHVVHCQQMQQDLLRKYVMKLAKGLDDVISTFERLASAGRDVRLVLAGPRKGGPVENRMIDEAVEKWPARVEFRGPVYGPEKSQFFADVDAFIFPTRTESWGIVLTEALAAGCPVVARSKGCVPWIVQHGCGVAVDPQANFVDQACATVTQWIESPEVFRNACAAATMRSAELQADADRQLPEFVSRVLDDRR